jgi:8-oxo-dGTP diphosphatase
VREKLGVIGVLRDGERILIVRRSQAVTMPGLWCFPGGHVEPGESLHDAIVREMHEELSVRVAAREHLGAVHVESSGYRLEVFAVELVSGTLEPRPEEIAEARWATPAEIRALGEPMPSNAAVLELLGGGPAPFVARDARDSG